MNHICLWLKTICCDYREGNVIFVLCSCCLSCSWFWRFLSAGHLCVLPALLCVQHHGRAHSVCLSGWICHFWVPSTNVLVPFVHKIAFNPHQQEKCQLLGIIIPMVAEAHRKPKKTKFSWNKIFTSSFLLFFSIAFLSLQLKWGLLSFK